MLFRGIFVAKKATQSTKNSCHHIITPANNINDIAIEELAAGLLAVIKHNVAVEKTSLYNFIAQQLGCRRAGDAMTNRLNEAFATIKRQLTVDGDVVSVK